MLWLLVLEAWLVCPGCNGAGRPVSIAAGLQAELPQERAAACVRAGATRDRSAVPLLVERLDDPAEDVRFFAIAALERITGQTLDYRYYSAPAERQAAVQRWRRWLAGQAGTTARAGKGGP